MNDLSSENYHGIAWDLENHMNLRPLRQFEAIKQGQKFIKGTTSEISTALGHPVEVDVMWDILTNDPQFKASKDYVPTVKRIGTIFIICKLKLINI